jgi:hypothetical protein
MRNVMRPSCGKRFLGDVELRHDLDTRNQRCVDAFFRSHDIAQHAIDAKAHHRYLFERFDVDIGCAFAQRLCQQRVDHADHRRVVGRFQQVFDRRHIEHQLGKVEIRFVLVDHLRGAVAGAGIGSDNRAAVIHLPEYF